VYWLYLRNEERLLVDRLWKGIVYYIDEKHEFHKVLNKASFELLEQKMSSKVAEQKDLKK
jgi:hypothetical protein